MNCRLLYLVGQLTSGGLERQLYYLLQSLDRNRYQPAVAVWNFTETDVYVSAIQALGVPLCPLPSPASAPRKLISFKHLVRSLDPEVVHSYTFFTNFAAYWASQGTRAIPFGSIRGDFTLDKRSTGWWLGRLSSYWPSHQICNSFSAAETIRRSAGFFLPRYLSVVRNGLDLGLFSDASPSPSTRACILGLGSLIPTKRWDRLLTTARELKQRGFDFVIRIAGEGPMERSLKEQAYLMRVSDCVEFLGSNDNVSLLLKNATLLVHPSDSEGCPNAVMEAMACGRAVVATDVGDVPFLVEDGKTGFIVPRGDQASLVERVVRLISDPNLNNRMGEAGRRKAEREFRLERLVSETLEVYRKSSWKDD